MNKFILPIILLLAAAFFLSPKVDAQTREECDKTRARASYNCLTGWTKCYYPCTDRTKDVSACWNTCKQSEDACDKQVDAEHQACLAELPKSKTDSPTTAVKENVKSDTSEVEQKNSQSGDCRKIFNQDLKKCSTDSNSCQEACSEQTKKPDGTIYFNSGEIYTRCIKESDCDGKRSACGDQTLANFRACGKSGSLTSSDKEAEVSEAKKETPAKSQPRQYPADIFEKIPVTVGGWFEFASAGIELGEFLTGFTKGFTIADDAIIEDEKEEKEWDQYYKSYNSLKSQGLTHEQIEATLQKPRKRDVSMSLQELDALIKAKLPAAESVTNVEGASDTKLYSWEVDSGALINSTNWEKIEFRQPVVEDNVTTRTIKLKEGEMEVKVKNGAPATNRFAVDANGFFDLFVIQTHFWIDYDPSKKLAKVGVYEGQVEIKTKSGKTIKVAPDGDKPGVVIISQKLSVVKLVLVGLIIVVVLGGIVWFIKKKTLLLNYLFSSGGL